jgi:hypothetical protein
MSLEGPKNIRHSCVGVFSQDTTEVLENRILSVDQCNPITVRFFLFVLEEKLSVLPCHLINCDLYFARIISSVSEVIFENIFLLL